jgi:hypothetical protein
MAITRRRRNECANPRHPLGALMQGYSSLGSEPAAVTHSVRNPRQGVCTLSPSHRSKTIQTILLELARCSQRYPCLAGTSSVAQPAWGEEGSKKPPSLRQAYLRRALCGSRGRSKVRAARGYCCLKARCMSCCIAATPDLTSASTGGVL